MRQGGAMLMLSLAIAHVPWLRVFWKNGKVSVFTYCKGSFQGAYGWYKHSELPQGIQGDLYNEFEEPDGNNHKEEDHAR